MQATVREDVLRRYFRANSGVIWDDALTEHNLLYLPRHASDDHDNNTSKEGERLQAKARMAAVVSSTPPARRHLIRVVG